MKEITKSKIKECFHDISMVDDNYEKTVKFGGNQGTDVGYNVQSVVDTKNKLITTFYVTNISPDQGAII